MPCSPCAEQRDPDDTGRTGLSRGNVGRAGFPALLFGLVFFPLWVYLYGSHSSLQTAVVAGSTCQRIWWTCPGFCHGG